MQARSMLSCGVCLCVSVGVSVTFVHSVKTNKDIFEFFSPPNSHTILVFPYQTGWRYSDGNPPPPNGGVACRWGRQKSRLWAYIWRHCLPSTLQQARCCQHGRRLTRTTATVPQVITLISLVVYCGYSGIRPASATRDNQLPSPWFYSARPTKRALALYAITDDRESCVWQHGSTLRRRQQNRIKLYALINPKPK